MSFKLSARVQNIKPSPTLAVTSKAAELRAAGKDIIGLGAGEPDFDTPAHIKQAAINAINEGFTKYTAVGGTPQLKAAIVEKFKRDNGLTYSPAQVLVSCGGKQSFFNLALSMLDAGDEVIIPAPFWVSYPDMVTVAEGVPVIVETTQKSRFKITPEQLSETITENTRLLVLNSPSNPTGMAYSRAELEALGEVLRQHPQVFIATDDMYEHILWADEPFCNIVMACPDLQDRTIVLNGVSKAYSMTGWRIGYAAGPEGLIKAMTKIQSQSTSNPTSISQVAAQAALEGDQSCVAEMKEAFKSRHDWLVNALNNIEGIDCAPGDGTFYAFPSIQGCIERIDGITDDVSFCEYLLNEAGVAAVPGSAFGSPGHIRLSFAVAMTTLEDAVSRIRKAVEKQGE